MKKRCILIVESWGSAKLDRKICKQNEATLLKNQKLYNCSRTYAVKGFTLYTQLIQLFWELRCSLTANTYYIISHREKFRVWTLNLNSKVMDTSQFIW